MADNKNKAPEFSDAFRRQLRQLFQWRRDVRRFRTTPLPDGVLGELLDMANLSPSVGLSQPWRFVSVKSSKIRSAVIADFERCNQEAVRRYSASRADDYCRLKLEGLREAPVQLGVFVDMDTGQGDGLGRQTMPETLHYSAVTAIYSLWLAARSYGIGVGWVSILNPEVVKKACDVPHHWDFIAWLCIGYPRDTSFHPELERAGWEKRRLLQEKIQEV
ncbi:5,6-dimethylbenzimidazole synthase [invertebrate metagenome]|uniref:5,6-dimethylbenzimidazole synthase n=1 Tax=invertebrate metagenome TaxID=1711999 RepID=A0A2H9T8N3_9ZZZZ